ncbi:hypothetical protein RRG08_009616 [Elysia crispata]|uniref:Uncharacterized protein n=1 Tax=Elysia crispata TaxID=231223 RepID=A0AAE1CM44_9GAST|nr:hypothetical protein RRG08_009616 [Elysia crispata]
MKTKSRQTGYGRRCRIKNYYHLDHNWFSGVASRTITTWIITGSQVWNITVTRAAADKRLFLTDTTRHPSV